MSHRSGVEAGCMRNLLSGRTCRRQWSLVHCMHVLSFSEKKYIFLFIAAFAGVAVNASEEFVLTFISHMVKLAAREISSREEPVADLALYYDATIVDASLTFLRYTVKRVNILGFLACLANVATSASQEEILVRLCLIV